MKCRRPKVDADIQLFWRFARALRENAPPIVPVKVRRVPKVIVDCKPCGGSCSLVTDRKDRPLYFVIEIEKAIRGREMLDALEHEWGHAYAWTTNHPIHPEHGDAWGMARARCYRVLQGLL
jgi:hypothetical protein